MAGKDVTPLFDVSTPNVELPTIQRPSITDEFSTCIQVYRGILSIMGQRSDALPNIKQAHIMQSLEEYGRLRMWGEQTRADLQPDTRGSLDNTLRDDGELKDAAVSMLRSLRTQLQLMVITLEHIQDSTSPDLPRDPGSDSDSSEVTSSSEGEGPDEEIEKDRTPTRPRISALLDDLSENIDTLFRFLQLLNRPGLHRRYVHSTGRNEFDPRVVHFKAHDLRHVQEKLIFWGQERKRLEENESEAGPEILDIRRTTAMFPTRNVELLCERLAKANTKRREQLLYWKRHPDVAPTSQVLPGEVEAGPPPSLPSVVVQPIVLTAARSPKSEKADTASRVSPSTTSKQSFSHATISERLDSQTVTGAPRTLYAESTTGRRSATRVPNLPDGALTNVYFDCPYCQTQLDSLKMSNRLNWKRHVFRDLRPYICTFFDCQNPDKLYTTRHDWVMHEQQMHRRQWVCEGHNRLKFHTKELFEIHIRECHTGLSEQHQLSILVEVSERPTEEDEIVACPLCPDELYLKTLRTHLSEHLEEIALFVLPLSIEESDDTDSKRAGGGESPSTMVESQSDESSGTSHGIGEGPLPSVYLADLIISIDFGVAHTAVTYCDLTQGTEKLKVIQSWPGRQAERNDHVPTLLCYPSGSATASSWGFLAEDESRTKGFELREGFMLRENTIVEERTAYLRFLDKYIQEFMRKSTNRSPSDLRVELLFTMPDTWKSPLREWFMNSLPWGGFGQASTALQLEHGPTHVISMSKLEALSLYTANQLPGMLNVNEWVIICNAVGENTVRMNRLLRVPLLNNLGLGFIPHRGTLITNSCST
ncbi:hypothetical protein BCR34DRAFT_287730 [Clohesyomyces aquaticus]|uniref:Oxidoreductase acuF-like C2H2 type zinc-finger domain-containing protein n=1 Tax=Clohesyomyces aquaticus TaxID=1231657 RepID=A0A1Y1ZRQ9_9PLEO|nr:hypothetical protein BCR34DRAFT_287730 [Clohesyomyces aquaticus]